MSIQIRGRLVTVLLAVVCLFPIGCTGKAATSDSTLPVIAWNVSDLEGLGFSRDYRAIDGGVAPEGGVALRFALRAKDPEGIESITIGGSAQWTCSGGRTFDDEWPDKTETLAPTTSGNVLTEYGALIDVYKLACPTGTRIVTGSYTMLGKASNYFDGVTSGKLFVQIPTPCDPGYRCPQGS